MYGVIQGEWIKGVAWASRPKPWVARIIGFDARFRYQREFVKPVYDYSDVHTRQAGRGIYLYFNCSPGFYEMFRPLSWNDSRDERFFFEVAESGSITRIPEEQLRSCLKNGILI